MSARPSTFAALDDAKARMSAPDGERTPGVPPWQAGKLLQPPADWSWRSTGTRGVYVLHRGDQELGQVSFMPGAVEHEGVALDGFVADLNIRHR